MGHFLVTSQVHSLENEKISCCCKCSLFTILAMVSVSLGQADAVLLVFAVDDRESFEQVAHLRDMVMESR